MIDMWFFSLALAVNKGLSPLKISGKKTKIIDGAIFSSDPWRIDALLLIAVEKGDDPSIVSNHVEVIKLAEGLANAGFQTLSSMLINGGAEPMWNLTDSVDELIKL